MKKQLFGFFLAILLPLLQTGCLSSHAGSSSLAYTVIQHTPIETVRELTCREFENEFYTIEKEGPAGYFFEREPTRQDLVVWSSFGEKDFRMRVVVTFEPFESDILVRADTYVVKNSLTAPQKVGFSGRRPYQKILDRIQANSISAHPQE